MKRASLVICFTWMFLFLQANEIQNDSIFQRAFRMRYEDPKKGITLSRELMSKDKPKASLAMAYNYFFLSDYDSAGKYLDLVMKDKTADTLVKTVARSCRGWIDQRIGQDYSAFNNFEACANFYSNDDNVRKYRNDQLFIDGYMINELGSITQKYYYIADFEYLNKQLVSIQNRMDAFPGVSNELKFHLQYLFVHNVFQNGSKKPDFPNFITRIENCLLLAEQSTVYQKGLLFEVLGLYMFYKNKYDPKGDYKIKSITLKCDTTISVALCSEIQRILNIENENLSIEQKEMYFKHRALETFLEHGDPYQIASSNYFIGEHFKFQIERDSVHNIDKLNYDSLRIYTETALKHFQVRFPQYYDTLSKINLRSYSDTVLCSRLVSIPWFVESLKLKLDYFIYRTSFIDNKNRIDSITFYNALISKVESFYLRNSRIGFYTAREEAAKKAIEADNLKARNKYIIFIIIGFALFFLATIIFYFFRKRKSDQRKTLEEKLNNELKAKETIERSQIELENWNKILNKLLNIREGIVSEQDVNIGDSLNGLNTILCDYFNSEYCAIGFLESEKDNKVDIVKDIAYKFVPDIPRDSKEQFLRLIKLPVKDSVIGKFLLSGKYVQLIKGAEIGKFINENLKAYKTFLKSGKVENIAISGVYQYKGDKQVPIGYISLINYKYDHQIEAKLRQISSEIARFLEIEENSRRIRNRQKDQGFINELNKDGVEISELISKTLPYLAKEFNARIISFRVPVINGPDTNDENNLIFVLRDVFVDPNITNHVEIENYYRNQKKTLSLADEITFKDELLKGFPDDIYLDKQGQDDAFIRKMDLTQYFKTKLNIILPVRKNYHKEENYNVNGNKLYWEFLFGIINIQPCAEPDSVDYQERMSFLMHHFCSIINNIINKNKIEQIKVLSNEISGVTIDSYDQSMSLIAHLIKKVVNAEACSLFIFNKNNQRVELKATTANVFDYNQVRNKKGDFKQLEKVFFDKSDTSSVTVRSISSGKIHMLYDLDLYKEFSRKFIEIIEVDGKEKPFNEYAWLIIPIMDNNKNVVGTIKLSGLKNIDHHLRHTFWDFEREILKLIASFTFVLIENAKLDYEKDSYLKHLIHELKNPVNELLLSAEATKSRMIRSGQLSNDFSKFFESLSNNIMLQKNIFSNIKDLMQPIILTKEVTDVHEILLFVVRLLEESASSEKQLTIKTFASRLPSLNIDKYRIQQVFINLLQNAINYSDDRSVIKISYEEKIEMEGGKLKIFHEIKFANTGIGILENEKDDIFKRYYRGSRAIMMKTSGMGIGLNLVREIMLAHGGNCVVRRLANPTEISVLFPAI